MTSLTTLLPILAQVAPSRKLAASFRNSGWQPRWDDVWPWLLVVAAGAVAYVTLAIRRQRNDLTTACNSPGKLFRELASAHGLERRSAKLLKRLARAQRFEQPAQIFLTPTAFAADALPPALKGQAAELQQLRARLF